MSEEIEWLLGYNIGIYEYLKRGEFYFNECLIKNFEYRLFFLCFFFGDVC